MTNTSTSSSKFFLIGAALSAIAALIVHSILYSHHLDLHFGAVTGQAACDINSTFSCSAVAASKWSAFLGVPIALWGFVANFAFLVLAGLWVFAGDESKPTARMQLLIVSGFIAASSLVMGTISTLMIGKACIYCMAAYALSFVLFVCTYLGTRGIPRPASIKAGDFTTLGILAIVGSIAVFIADDNIKRSSQFDQIEKSVNSYVQSWQASPAATIQTVEPLVKGPAADQAKMTVVEYADFRCSHCKHAAPSMKAFSEAHPDVRFEFQAWPLDGECNSAINQANGVSCLLARVVWCAQKLGGAGWALHDAIFNREAYMSSEAVVTALPELTQGTSLDVAALKTCTESDEMKAMIRKMAEGGTALNLRGTPTIYVNGKLLPGGQTLPVLSGAYNSIK